MYFLKKLDSAILLLLSLLIGSCGAQIKNKKNEKVTVYGNCRMCEKKIEVAGNIKGIVKVEWEKDTKQATLIYDSKKTNTDEILKRIALSGYDSDKFRIKRNSWGLDFLSIYFSESEEEEFDVPDTPGCCSECLYLCIERFCRRIRTPVDKEVEYGQIVGLY